MKKKIQVLKKIYISPDIEVVEIEIEQNVFAGSSANPSSVM